MEAMSFSTYYNPAPVELALRVKPKVTDPAHRITPLSRRALQTRFAGWTDRHYREGQRARPFGTYAAMRLRSGAREPVI